VKAVAREEVVLKIRFARLMAWMKRTDVSLVDYPGWTAFVNEKSYWKESRTRELIRFVDSGLDHIMMLVACKVIALSLGIRASKELPRNASEYDQLGWLADAVENSIPPRDRSRMREIHGDAMRFVETARTGRQGTRRVHRVGHGDRSLHHRLLRAEAERRADPRASQGGAAAAGSTRRAAAAAVGTRAEASDPRRLEEPKDQDDCMAQLDFVRARLDERRMILGMAYVHVKDHELWKDNFYGSPTLEKFCSEFLEIDQRTFERWVAEGRELFIHPEACTAIASGRVTGDRAQFAISHSSGFESLEPMIDLASRPRRRRDDAGRRARGAGRLCVRAGGRDGARGRVDPRGSADREWR
jgi:hypothetical protein